MRSTTLNNFNVRSPKHRESDAPRYLLRLTDTRARRIIQNHYEAPKGWQSYRRSVSGANCSFVALWMLAIYRSRYPVICAFPFPSLPVALSCTYFLRKVSNRIYSCPENRRAPRKTRKSIAFIPFQSRGILNEFFPALLSKPHCWEITKINGQ